MNSPVWRRGGGESCHAEDSKPAIIGGSKPPEVIDHDTTVEPEPRRHTGRLSHSGANFAPVSNKHDGPDNTSPYPVSRLAPAFDLVDVAAEIQRADAMLGAVTEGKLRLIAEQMLALRKQAEEILASAKDNADLHRAACAFTRRPGQVYHLYERPDGRRYFSMLSPDDWGTPPHTFVGSFRLQSDMSWQQED